MDTTVRIIMTAIIFFVCAFYFSLFIRGLFLVCEAHQQSVNIDIKRLKIKCIVTLFYSLCMFTFGIMYHIGIHLNTITYILLIFSFIVALISGLCSGIFLSWKDLKEIADLIKSK